MTWRTTVSVRSSVPAPAARVWERATSVEGINHELGPWLKMTVPRGLKDVTLETAPRGVTLGRSWVLFLGIVPVDYDDLCLAELEPGLRFLERSRLASMKVWEHEREITDDGTVSVVTDRLTFEPRLLLRIVPGSERVAAAIVRRLFEHRHRRLVRYFEAN